MVYEDSHYKPSTKELMDTINYNNYGIQITHETEEEEVVSSRYFSNRIISSAYADNMEFLPLDTISTIQIVTNQDFDSTHLAGSNVTDLFVDSWNQNSIQEALENDPYFYLSQSFKYYVLTTSPTTTKSYDFTVKYNFTNGKVLETTIDKVVIKSQK